MSSGQYCDACHRNWFSCKCPEDVGYKPPTGLRPKMIVDVLRLKEIHEAMGRYLEAGKYIPQEWVDEFSIINSERAE